MIKWNAEFRFFYFNSIYLWNVLKTSHADDVQRRHASNTWQVGPPYRACGINTWHASLLYWGVNKKIAFLVSTVFQELSKLSIIGTNKWRVQLATKTLRWT